ncbi:transporter [Nocardiopsis gilva YIM 90087]|uniref:Transporter n=1 Tax=Nocardiopsis gilva YIM 90087 TaxID=1235441 RepID=A0A223S8M8_9ACTN|nr:potassium channel family protein [Nocardiopsis gilva]ASU84466.1 transporter [Nocardiopsis gilva YIM 90087]
MVRTWTLGIFLVSVALLQFGYPLTLHGSLWTAVYMLLYTGMIVFGIMLVREESLRTVPIFVVAVVFLIFGLWVAVDQESEAAHLGMFISVAVFQSCLMVSLLRFIFRRSQAHGPDLILAAVCVYLLLGGLFAATFGAVEIVWPGSFEDSAAPEEPVTWQQLMYFSYVTMATLGYGDVLPLTPWVRSLAVVETVSGTLFLTTVIARLVGAYIAPADAAGAGGDRGDVESPHPGR